MCIRDSSRTVTSGKFDAYQEQFASAMDVGLKTLHYLLEVSHKKASGQMKDQMLDIPIMKPPSKSFCPKCGSDILENTMFQWKKWQGLNNDLLAVEIESAMSAALMHSASSYIDEIRELKSRIETLESQPPVEVKEDATASDEEQSSKKDDSSSAKKETKKQKEEKPKKQEKKATEKKSKAAPKKSGGLFGAKKPKRTYEGEPGGKADWFLNEALDTVYDPHGTGKKLKPNTILARSSDGNVRVRDVIYAYAEKGEDEVTELAHTSPVTKYLIEAFDAC